MSKAWAGGSTRQWRTRRAQVLQRDHHQCTIRIPGTCQTTADCVHHIHGKGRCIGCATDQPDHLAAACTPCNLRIGEPRPTRPQPKKGLTQW